MFPNGQAKMKLCLILFSVLLLLNETLSESQRDDSVIIRDPDISASWYTGRGIRPLGRFGRNAARRNELVAFITARVYRPTADSGIWITQ